MRKPYFDRSKNAWYWINPAGKKTRLGETEQEAYDTWGRLQRDEPALVPLAPLADILEAYLADSQGRLSAQTWTQRGRYLYRVATGLGHRPAGEVRPVHVDRWLDGERVTQSTRAAIVKSLRAAIRWAVSQGILPHDTMTGLRKPQDDARTHVVDPDAARRIWAECEATRARRALRAVLWLLSATGARPGEIRRLEARHIDWDRSAATLPPLEHKTGRKTGKPRHIVLIPCAVTLCRIAAERHPTGPLLRNSRGRPWASEALSTGVTRLRRVLGLSESLVAYSLRHTYATRALTAGLDMLTVAQLLGHSSPDMLAKHYAHLEQCSDYLRQQAARVNPRKAE